MNYNWNWGIYLYKIKGGEETYLSWLLTGLQWTVAVTLCSWIIALVLEFLVGTLRTAPRWATR